MKNIFLFLFFWFFFLFQNLYSAEWKINNDWQLKVGGTITGQFKSNNKMILPLDDGTWSLIYKHREAIYAGIIVDELLFAQFEGEVPTKFFSIGRIDNLGKYMSDISAIIQNEVFRPKKNGCKSRQHYNYLKFIKKGFAHNCMYVKILDVQRELYPSDYDKDAIFTSHVRRWIKKNNIKIPDIYLDYTATYHAMTVRPAWYVLSLMQTPESFANYKPKFTSRDTSEFHPDKINDFPLAKKIMKGWIEKSTALHKDFEKFQKVKKHHELDLSDYFVRKPKRTIKKTKKTGGNITDELNKLNDLYQSGALTKEEFVKAKAKLLN